MRISDWSSDVCASDLALDQRCQYPALPYDALEVRMATRHNGDVAARVNVRFDEVIESLRLIRRIVQELPAGAIRNTLELPPRAAFGVGWVEGWRGDILVALELVPHAGAVRIRR